MKSCLQNLCWSHYQQFPGWSSMINDTSTLAHWRLPRSLVTVCQHAAIFRPLNNSLIWLTPIALSLLQAFCCLERNENVTNVCYTTLLSGSDRHIWQCWEAAKNHTCTWKFFLPLRLVSPSFHHYLSWENIVECCLDRPYLCAQALDHGGMLDIFTVTLKTKQEF
jgi:hypothetical protein